MGVKCPVDAKMAVTFPACVFAHKPQCSLRIQVDLSPPAALKKDVHGKETQKEQH